MKIGAFLSFLGAKYFFVHNWVIFLIFILFSSSLKPKTQDFIKKYKKYMSTIVGKNI
jgi:hypothetical protein